jgi:hypothetical protein
LSTDGVYSRDMGRGNSRGGGGGGGAPDLGAARLAVRGHVRDRARDPSLRFIRE